MNQVINTNSFPELGNRAHTSFSTCETSSLSGLSNLFGKDWVQKNKNSGRWSINPLHPNISMHILRTVIYSFTKMLTRRTSQTIKSFSLALVGDPFIFSQTQCVTSSVHTKLWPFPLTGNTSISPERQTTLKYNVYYWQAIKWFLLKFWIIKD